MNTTADLSSGTHLLAPATAHGLAMAFSFADEFREAQFGDQRLNARVVRFLDSALRHPESSLPVMAGGYDGAEGVYRLIANDKATTDAISEPHADQTLERCRAAGTVLVLHDTTTFGYGKDTKRQGLGEIAGGGVGFLAHVSLCVAEGSRRPLGVLRHKAFVRPPASEKPRGSLAASSKGASRTVPDNESRRWFEHALQTGKALGATLHVHVADRESDDYKYLAELDTAGEAFVTRVSTNRVLGKGAELYEKMDGMVVQMCREVHLTRRGAAPGAKQRKTNPPRDEREARLEISAGTVTIPRTQRAPRTTPKSLQLNYVLVREIDVPVGLEPVVWRLVTNLPVQTPEQIARVVDIYRARWVIEEFFKALKTGCSFNKHQLESYQALTKLLALLLPLACKLLELRTVVRLTPEAPATVVLTARQVACLRVLHDKQHKKAKLPPKPTIKQAAMAIAVLGGHFPNNGDPGWRTLGAGLQRLLQAEHDWLALSEQLTNPKAVPQRR